jgi:hypothetical protein
LTTAVPYQHGCIGLASDNWAIFEVKCHFVTASVFGSFACDSVTFTGFIFRVIRGFRVILVVVANGLKLGGHIDTRWV